MSKSPQSGVFVTPQLKSSQCWTIKESLDVVRITHSVVRQNHEDLRLYMMRLNNDKAFQYELVGDYQNLDARNRHIAKMFKLLYNLISILSTLVDHCRLTYRNILNEGYRKEYDSKVGEMFTSSERALFIGRLRNYFSHKGNKGLIYQFSLPVENSVKFYLNRDVLLDEFDWSGAPKSFLQSQELLIEIDKLFDPYFEEIYDFYMWLNDKHEIWFEDEINEFNRLT